MLRRAFDILFAGAALLLASPLMILTAVAISLDGGPVFFRQKRSGLRGSEFGIFKFRSMRTHTMTTAELIKFHGQVTHSHPDVTLIGRWIRRFKVDELPQLINVVRGEMSVVGPRPTIPEQVIEYTSYQLRRLEVRPGLTGWAQVNGGIEFSWPERILLDVWYVAHRTLWLDLWILLKTASVVLFGDKRNVSALLKAEEFARRSASNTQRSHTQPDLHSTAHALTAPRVTEAALKE